MSIRSLLASFGLGSAPAPAAPPAPPAGGSPDAAAAAQATVPAAPAGAASANPNAIGPTTGDAAFTDAQDGLAHVRLLGLNDFHGQLSDSTAKLGNDAVGGAATLAAYMQRERAAVPNGTVTLSVGDAVGASEPASTLLRHESAFAVLAALGINLATFGNHEFDRGFDETMRLILGGTATGPATAAKSHVDPRKRRRGAKAAATSGAATGAAAAGKRWPGSPFPWVSANVVDVKTGRPVLPPYAIMEVNGVKVAFIGAVTGNLKNVTLASGITNIKALDPATAINRYIPEIKAQGVKAIVAFVHEGGEADKQTGAVTGAIVPLAKALDPEVDVVMSAHSHQEYATRIAGKVVTQGLSYGKAFSEVDLAIDPKTGDVVKSSGRVIHNLEAGIAPDPQVEAMVRTFQQAVAPRTERVLSVLPGPITRVSSPAGETPLGTLIAEAQRAMAKTDIAFMNPGGIRQDLPSGGPVTWGTAFGVQPFANHVMRTSMTGAQIARLLEQQFHADGSDPTILQVAGLRVTVDASKPVGHRIVSITDESGTPIDPKRTYTVAMNSFLIDGGDGFTVFKESKAQAKDIGIDLDALVAWLQAGKPVPIAPTGRLSVVHGTVRAHEG
jgi:5'-nucleotidase